MQGDHDDDREAQVDGGRGHVEGEGFLGRVGGDLRLAHDLVEGDQRHQRGVLQQDQVQVAEAGQGDPPDLRQDDAPEDPSGRQAERLAGLAMAARNGQQRAAEHLGGVGAEAQAEGQGAGGERRERQVRLAEKVAEGVQAAHRAEIDHQYPERFRHATDDGGVGAAEETQGRVLRSLRDGAEEAEQQPHADRRQRQLEGHPGTGEQLLAEPMQVENHEKSGLKAATAGTRPAVAWLGINRC